MKPARLIAFVTSVTLMVPAVVGAQTTAQTQSQAQTQTQKPAPPPPDNLKRIREGVNRDSTLKLENGQLKIYVTVIAKWPSFAEMAKGYDLMNGPAATKNAMSHAEFLSMVTPREMYGSAGIQPAELLTMALVNYFGQKAIKKGIEQISKTRDEREIQAIRAQIDRELAALAANRGGGGRN